MTRLIVVQGPGNTGKTTAIKEALEHGGIFPNVSGDITMVVPIEKNGVRLKLGIASGGDNLSILRASFAFLRPHKCDVIICATRSRGTTVGFVASLKYPILTVATSKVPVANIKKYNSSIARKIWSHV